MVESIKEEVGHCAEQQTLISIGIGSVSFSHQISKHPDASAIRLETGHFIDSKLAIVTGWTCIGSVLSFG